MLGDGAKLAEVHRSIGTSVMRHADRDIEVELALCDELPPAELITTGMVLPFAGDRILLTRLASRGWDIPGGHREEGETPLDAARRELFEETGARMRRSVLFGWQRYHMREAPPDGWRYPWPEAFQVFFVAEVDGHVDFAGNEEALEAALFTPAEAVEIDWVKRHREFYDEALRRARLEFSRPA